MSYGTFLIPLYRVLFPFHFLASSLPFFIRLAKSKTFGPHTYLPPSFITTNEDEEEVTGEEELDREAPTFIAIGLLLDYHWLTLCDRR